jgi:plasmid stabilization system protein ParE
MGYRLSPQAATDLQEIWDYIAEQSGRTRTATQQLEAIALRFPFLADHPFAGRRAMMISARVEEAFRRADTSSSIA